MKLKTYTAETMAQALAQVRKDLGPNAMILHTRSYRTGAWFGIGGKNMVEITASSPNPSMSSKKQLRPMPRVASQQAPAQRAQPPIQAQPQRVQSPDRQPEIVIQRGATVTRQRLEREMPVVGAMNAQAAQVAQTARSQEPNATSSDGKPAFEANDAGGFIPDTHKELHPREPERTQGRDALFSQEFEAKPRRTHPQSNLPTRKLPEVNMEPKPVTSPRTPKPVSFDPADIEQAPKKQPVKAQSKTPPQTENQSPDELRAQIDTLSKMMGQVLESTRKTAVAVGTGQTADALPSGEMPAPLFALYAKMLDNDVPVEVADRLVGSIRDRFDALELKDPLIVRQALLRAIETTIETRSESLLMHDREPVTGRPRVIALVGPTGVGKTTTVAKLAATYKLRHGKKVGLITSDTYRIAAVEQLRTYAGIIGLPIKVANSPQELAAGIEQLWHENGCEIVVIDTAGRSQNNAKRLEELAEFTKAANPDETHLVLSTTVGDNVLRKTAQSFKALGPDRCILTKLDEAVTTGPIAGLSDRIGLPLSFITVGQEVPDDLEPARADRLARCVLDGPEAVVRGISEEIG